MLPAAERETLRAVCTTFFPGLQPGAGDDPGFFGLDAAAVGVPAAAEEALESLPPPLHREVRGLLRALETPLGSGVLGGTRRPFGRLDAAGRERLLLRMADHPLPRARAGFQALKRLSLFLAYALPDASSSSPTWPALGYAPPREVRPRQAPLRVRTLEAPTVLECDVCVIGSGAGGSVAAAELAAGGRSVLVLEAGPGDQSTEFQARELHGMRRLYLDGGSAASRDLGIVLLAGAALGGGTTVNWQTCLRLPANVRDEWAELSDCRIFTEPAFDEAFDAVGARLHVGTAETWVNANNDALRRGCASLGLPWRLAPRNARGCARDLCGYCVFGCPRGGRQCAQVTFLRDAQEVGDAQVVVHCRAERLRFEGGRVTGVSATALDPASGRSWPLTVRSTTVVVAAGAIHSPALLLRSGLRLPAIGRHLFLHPTAAVAGLYPDRIEAWRGPVQSVVCEAFAELDGPYGFRLETPATHPGLAALALPWLGAREHRRLMAGFSQLAAFIALVRDRRGGRVRIDGEGRPVVEYRPGPMERRHIRAGTAAAARIHAAAGADEILTLHTRPHRLRSASSASSDQLEAFLRDVQRASVAPNRHLFFSAHQMGTCRMGPDARSAVCGADGQVFGVRGLYVADGSLFPASSGVNPVLTIMALGREIARGIARG